MGDAHKRFDEQLLQVSEVQERLTDSVAQRARLRTESENLRESIRAQTWHAAELKLELTAAHTQADKRRKAVQDRLEAQFMEFHECAIAALAELPALGADAERPGG